MDEIPPIRVVLTALALVWGQYSRGWYGPCACRVRGPQVPFVNDPSVLFQALKGLIVTFWVEMENMNGFS